MKSSVLGLSSDLDFYYYQKPVPSNIGMESLIGMVVNEFDMTPSSGDVFVFVTANGRLLRLLHYDGTGYTLYVRWLEGKRFWQPVYDEDNDLYLIDWYRLKHMLNSCLRT